ncbi:hypothetical protein, partial [Pseudodesulfovibrio senegalensis]|uniref:hypothetical protein n=1 Tax=Pseudodesulfovibrio senegalensis TaxID=1721087 RepID=UPI0019D54B49
IFAITQPCASYPGKAQFLANNSWPALDASPTPIKLHGRAKKHIHFQKLANSQAYPFGREGVQGKA